MIAAKVRRFVREQYPNASEEEIVERVGAAFDEYVDWGLTAGAWAQEVHEHLLNVVLIEKLKKELRPPRLYWLPEDAVVEIEEYRLPLVARHRNNES